MLARYGLLAPQVVQQAKAAVVVVVGRAAVCSWQAGSNQAPACILPWHSTMHAQHLSHTPGLTHGTLPVFAHNATAVFEHRVNTWSTCELHHCYRKHQAQFHRCHGLSLLLLHALCWHRWHGLHVLLLQALSA